MVYVFVFKFSALLKRRHRIISSNSGLLNDFCFLYCVFRTHVSDADASCRNMPFKTRSRRPEGNSLKQIEDGIQADVSNMVTVGRNKRSSRLQLRSSFAETSFGDNYEQTELRDGNETHSMDTAGSSKEKAVKKKKRDEI